MTEYEIKVLITSNGHHIVTYMMEDTHPDFMRVKNPMLVNYHPVYDEYDSPGKVEASFIKFCSLSEDNEFSLNCHWILAALAPTDSVREAYLNTINPPTLETEHHDSDIDSVE